MTAALTAVLARPALWATAIRQMFRLRRRRWWARAPFLPLPADAYLSFRLVTQYGDESARPAAADLVSYLRWCREWERYEPAHEARPDHRRR